MRHHRSVMASEFTGNSAFEDKDDVDPMSSVANIVDCMLVLACGLMLAIITYWNLDVSPAMQEVVQDENLTEVPADIEDAQAAMGQGNGYTELGVVYQDPTTGKMYMVKKENS
jgi:hypothetical protein